MASRDDSPTSLHGQPWSVWADRLGRDSPISDNEDQIRLLQGKKGDAMKLPKKDMSYYGLCPVRDEFYLVTCNYCQRVYTPQGLKNHIELNHGQDWQPRPYENSESAPAAAGPVAPAPTVTAKLKGGRKAPATSPAPAGLPTSLAVLLATPPAPKSRNNKRGASSSIGGVTSKQGFSQGPACAKIPPPLTSALTGIPYDKVPSPQQPPPFSPLQRPAASPSSPLTASVVTSSPAITMTVAVDSSGVQTVQIHLPEISNGASPTDLVEAVSHPTAASTTATTVVAPSAAVAAAAVTTTAAPVPENSRSKKRKSSKTERRLLPLKEREFDPEKHCGVWMADMQKPCTRSLTCKAHSLSLRRAVANRSRSFDELLAEHRAAKEALVKQLKEGFTTTMPAITTSALTTTTTISNNNSTTITREPIASVNSTAKDTTTIKVPPSSPQCKIGSKARLATIVGARNELKKSLVKTASAVAAAAATIVAPTTAAVATSVTSELMISTAAATPASVELSSASSPLLQRVFPSVNYSFTAHHPKPLAVCSFGLRKTNHMLTMDRKWDFLRSTLRSSLHRPVARSSVDSAVVQNVLMRPAFASSASSASSSAAAAVSGALLARDNSIELTNGLQLSIGVKPEVGGHTSQHRVALKKGLTNGHLRLPGGQLLQQQHHHLHQQDLHHRHRHQDATDGFDGLVGEDGVLTFLNQSNEGSASLSLMADLSAGNITFSEMMADSAAAKQQSHQSHQRPAFMSTSSSFLLQPDPGDQL